MDAMAAADDGASELDSELAHYVQSGQSFTKFFWHFDMLRDHPRNLAYRRGIDAAVVREKARLGHGPHVVDIGALLAASYSSRGSPCLAAS